MSKKNRQDRAARQAVAEMPVKELKAMAEKQGEHLVDFDGWWAARATKIPGHHHKEIIKADFRGRGLSMMETMEDYDDALKDYGLKL